MCGQQAEKGRAECKHSVWSLKPVGRKRKKETKNRKKKKKKIKPT